MKHPNSTAREFAFQFLYQLNQKGIEQFKESNEVAEMIAEFETNFEWALAPEVKSFAVELIKTSINDYSDLKNIVDEFAVKSFEALAPVEQVALLMGSCELRLLKQSPKNVIINEAIEISKKFGTKDSGPMINAILDKIGE